MVRIVFEGEIFQVLIIMLFSLCINIIKLNWPNTKSLTYIPILTTVQRLQYVFHIFV